MKRYLLFTFTSYYPSGGWKDFSGSFDTEMGAVQAAVTQASEGDEHYQVVDSTTGTVTFSDRP
jgi:hypothetical protein